MSHLSSSLAPHETQVNYLHTDISSLSKLWLQIRFCCIVWLCPIDDTDLYLYLHIFSLSFSVYSVPPFHTLMTKTYHKIPMTFILTPFLTLGFFWCNCADRAQGIMSLFSTARCQTNPLEMDYRGGRGSCSGGGY